MRRSLHHIGCLCSLNLRLHLLYLSKYILEVILNILRRLLYALLFQLVGCHHVLHYFLRVWPPQRVLILILVDLIKLQSV